MTQPPQGVDRSDWTPTDWTIADKVVDTIHTYRFVDITVRVRHSEPAKVDTNISELIEDICASEKARG
jgi:hypothetical protein